MPIQFFNKVLTKIRKRIVPGLRYLAASKIRLCRCCNKKTLVVSFSKGEERKLCIRCRANLRYEMIADYLRLCDLNGKTIVEFDSRSPLHCFLNEFSGYIRTYYSETEEKGKVKKDRGGILRCEDITSMTFDNDSIDIMISSDVLEHVPNIYDAFKEMARVLSVGGKSIFTVPNHSGVTKQRAFIENNKIIHIESPQYHSDPLTDRGILAFWDFGLDMEKFAPDNLKVYVANGPVGLDNRILWVAEKISSGGRGDANLTSTH